MLASSHYVVFIVFIQLIVSTCQNVTEIGCCCSPTYYGGRGTREDDKKLGMERMYDDGLGNVVGPVGKDGMIKCDEGYISTTKPNEPNGLRLECKQNKWKLSIADEHKSCQREEWFQDSFDKDTVNILQNYNVHYSQHVKDQPTDVEIIVGFNMTSVFNNWFKIGFNYNDRGDGIVFNIAQNKTNTSCQHIDFDDNNESDSCFTLNATIEEVVKSMNFYAQLNGMTRLSISFRGSEDGGVDVIIVRNINKNGHHKQSVLMELPGSVGTVVKVSVSTNSEKLGDTMTIMKPIIGIYANEESTEFDKCMMAHVRLNVINRIAKNCSPNKEVNKNDKWLEKCCGTILKDSQLNIQAFAESIKNELDVRVPTTVKEVTNTMSISLVTEDITTALTISSSPILPETTMNITSMTVNPDNSSLLKTSDNATTVTSKTNNNTTESHANPSTTDDKQDDELVWIIIFAIASIILLIIIFGVVCWCCWCCWRCSDTYEDEDEKSSVHSVQNVRGNSLPTPTAVEEPTRRASSSTGVDLHDEKDGGHEDGVPEEPTKLAGATSVANPHALVSVETVPLASESILKITSSYVANENDNLVTMPKTFDSVVNTPTNWK